MADSRGFKTQRQVGMIYCGKPVPGIRRACGYEINHEEESPCRPDIICNLCGDGIYPDNAKLRCRICRNRHGKEDVKMNQQLIDAVTKWREIYEKIETYEPILKPLVEEEAKLRKAVIEAAFPEGQENHEGTNNIEIWPGWILKAVVKISRQVDEAALPAVREQLVKMGVSGDVLIRMKPEVALKAYRELEGETKKVFDQCLVVKPSTPTLQLLEAKGTE